MNPLAYDLVVLGAGPAGERGAVSAALSGRKVAIVERCREVGGAAANTGTLPSKTLRETALALSGLRARDLYGVDLSLRREASVADLLYHERRVTANERHRILDNLAHHRVDLFHGRGRFEDPHTIRVTAEEEGGTGAAAPDDLLLGGGKILIATGSFPFRPAEFPFGDPRVFDSDGILQIERLPRAMAIVGAGPIGCEYACTFSALGVQVHLIEGNDALLPFLDREIAAALLAAMEKIGVTFHWNEKVARCETPAGDVILELASGRRLAADAVLVAAGRTGRTAELDLPAAGLAAARRGVITVDEHFRTAVPHIYAVGDVIGFPALASTSMEQARVAMCHAFDQTLKTAMAPVLPLGIYTIPEVSMVGETEESLRSKGIAFVAGRARYARNARGEIIGDETGFLKLLFRREDMRLLGAHVIGEQASELVHLGLLAMLTESGFDLFNRACFNYPTLGNLYKSAAYDAMNQQGS